MNKTNVRMLMRTGLFTFAAVTLALFGVSYASADSGNGHNDSRSGENNKPRLFSDISTTKNSATLSFRDRKFRNQTVDVVVSVKNNSTDVLVEKGMKATLDEKGNGTVTVKGLKSGTSYDFKVRILRSDDENKMRSTMNSDDREASTM